MLKYFIEFFTIKQVYRTILTVFIVLFLYYLLTSLLDHIIVKGKKKNYNKFIWKYFTLCVLYYYAYCYFINFWSRY